MFKGPSNPIPLDAVTIEKALWSDFSHASVAFSASF
jgi:hypothetical protein